MEAKYILKNFEIYTKNYGIDSEEVRTLMNSFSTSYIREYRNNLNKFETKEEKEVIRQMINYFEYNCMYIRCSQLVKIRDCKPLGQLNIIVLE